MIRRISILMVDNNPGDLQLVELAIQDADLAIDVVGADDGVDGQRQLERLAAGNGPRHRAVLLDLNMPGLDGQRLLAWIRGTPALSALPVIILTSSYLDRDRERCMALGATDYWVKPGTFTAYAEMIRRLGQLCADVDGPGGP